MVSGGGCCSMEVDGGHCWLLMVMVLFSRWWWVMAIGAVLTIAVGSGGRWFVDDC